MDDVTLTRRIFARSWQCLAHESQLPQAGDYRATRSGQAVPFSTFAVDEITKLWPG